MISEFVVLPDVFEASAGCSGAAHDACMAQLTELFLNWGVVRDLRRGEWRRTVLENAGHLTTAGRQLFQTLVSSNRLREIEASPLPPPSSAEEWLWEARRSQRLGIHDRSLLASLATPELADREADPFVVSIQRLHAAPWWEETRSNSVRLQRQTNDYIRHLKPVFRHSNSLLFIDPHLNPQKPGYAQFGALLRGALHAEGKPDLIEIHRSCKDSGATVREQYPSRTDWITRFAELGRELSAVGLSATVFIWEAFHDRYFISNLMGLSIPNGFDVCTDAHRQEIPTFWTKLRRGHADEIRRKFNRSNQERLRFEPFDIGGNH